MGNLVRQLAKLAFLTAIVAMTASVAAAQSSGTVTLGGSVENSASLRWWSFSALNSETGANAPNTQNSPLLFTLNVGDVSPNNTNNYAGGKVKVILRTNAAYVLSAELTASSGFGSVANGDIALSDVGFDIGSLANSGGLVSGDPAVDATFGGSFGVDDPSLAAKDADGIPTYTNTLNTISGGPVSVLSGPRISKRGSVNSPNNGLLVDTIYAIGPQFYTPTNFSATVTFTITNP